MLNLDKTRVNPILKSHNIVSRLHVRHTFTNGFDDASALVTEDYGKGSLWIFPRQRVRILLVSVSSLLAVKW